MSIKHSHSLQRGIPHQNNMSSICEIETIDYNTNKKMHESNLNLPQCGFIVENGCDVCVIIRDGGQNAWGRKSILGCRRLNLGSWLLIPYPLECLKIFLTLGICHLNLNTFSFKALIILYIIHVFLNAVSSYIQTFAYLFQMFKYFSIGNRKKIPIMTL